jgi:arylsulfatase A-like enzyme
MKKRSLLRPTPLLGLAVLLSLVATTQAARPNILLIMADDQGWGDTGYNGHPVLKTPNLDAMAAAGLRFDRFYAAAPVCSPTRGSVMTGRHPNRFGCFQWGHALRPQETTIAEALHSAGYVTGHFGKWHLGSVRKGSPVNPGNSGFDHWLSAPNFYDNDPILSREGRAVKQTGESSVVAADAAIDFIRQASQDDAPFLAVVWFGSPHSPHRAAPEDLAHYQDQSEDAHWLGEITGLDRAVGKLRAELHAQRIDQNTLVWYCSDNGGRRLTSSGGRAKKGRVYEGGLRVPAIIQWPAKIPKPRVTDIPALTSDIYPTLLDIVGVQVPGQAPLDGISLTPILEQQQLPRPTGIGFWDFAAAGIGTPSATWMKELYDAQQAGDQAVQQTRLRLDAGQITRQYPASIFPGHAAWLAWPWKLHRIDGKKKSKSPQPTAATEPRFELYNLADDPQEATNLAAAETERVKSMRADLHVWLTSVLNSLNGNDYPTAP